MTTFHKIDRQNNQITVKSAKSVLWKKKKNILTRAYEMPVSEKDLKELDGTILLKSNLLFNG